METLMMLRMVSETRRSKQRACWLDNINTDTKMNFQQLKESMLDRVAWTALTYKVAKSQIEPND